MGAALVPHRCKLDTCDEPVPRKPGERPCDWRRRLYCGDQHKRVGMGRRPLSSWRTEQRPCAGRDCSVVFVPNFKEQRFHAQACSASKRPAATGSKPCECGCGPFERPRRLSDADWEKRRFASPECYQRWSKGRPASPAKAAAMREPGAATAGNRKPPKVPGAKSPRIGGNAQIDTPLNAPKTPRRPVFDTPPPAEPWRPGRVSVVEPYQQPKTRPSFGLRRRSA